MAVMSDKALSKSRMAHHRDKREKLCTTKYTALETKSSRMTRYGNRAFDHARGCGDAARSICIWGARRRRAPSRDKIFALGKRYRAQGRRQERVGPPQLAAPSCSAALVKHA